MQVPLQATPPPPPACRELFMLRNILCSVAIYAPIIYTAPCVMFLMRADPLGRRASGRGLGPGIMSFWALWNGIEPIGECHLGPKKLSIYWAQPPPTCPSNGSARIENHYVQGRINHRCIGSFMYKILWVTLTGFKGVSSGVFKAHTTPPVRLSNITALLLPITKLIRNQE